MVCERIKNLCLKIQNAISTALDRVQPAAAFAETAC
jgi:hypothetical protein